MAKNKICLYEILVPTTINGFEISLARHKEWDEKVSKISGGLTIFAPIKGGWLAQKQLLTEEMIPVRIACTFSEILKITEVTKQHYEQNSVMFYKVSDEVYFR